MTTQNIFEMFGDDSEGEDLNLAFGTYSDGGEHEVVVRLIVASGFAMGYYADEPNDIDSHDICVIGFETRDGKQHTFTLLAGEAFQLALGMLKFIEATTDHVGTDEEG